MSDRQVYHPALSPDQFGTLLHGTHREMQPGDMVQPPKISGVIESNPAPNLKQWHRQQGHVFATSRFSTATYYADKTGDGGGHVYQVEPTGPVKDDTFHPGGTSFMSRHPMRVVKEY